MATFVVAHNVLTSSMGIPCNGLPLLLFIMSARWNPLRVV